MPPTNAPFYRERRHRRRPAASCRCHFLRLGGSRIEYSRGPQLLEGIGKQGRREGDFPIAKESLSKPRFRRRLQSCGPRVANRAAPVFDLHERECTMLRYTNPLIESQRLMYSSRSLRTWSAVYGPSLELNDCQPVCR